MSPGLSFFPDSVAAGKVSGEGMQGPPWAEGSAAGESAGVPDDRRLFRAMDRVLGPGAGGKEERGVKVG